MKNFVLIIKKNILPIGAGFITATLLLLTFLQVPRSKNEICIYVADKTKLINNSNVQIIESSTNPKLIKVIPTDINNFDLWLRKNTNHIDYSANESILKNLHFVNDLTLVDIINNKIIYKSHASSIFNTINNKNYGDYLSFDSQNNLKKDTSLISGTAQLSAPAVYAIFNGLTANDKIEFARYDVKNVPQIGIKITKQKALNSEYYNFSTDPGKPISPSIVNLFKYLFF